MQRRISPRVAIAHGLPRFLRRGEEISPNPRSDRRQGAVANLHARIEIERGDGDFDRRAGKHVGENRLALHDAGVAEARLARHGPQAIDKRYGATARLHVQRRADADDSGAKDDDIGFRRGHAANLLVAGSRRLCARRGAALAMGYEDAGAGLDLCTGFL